MSEAFKSHKCKVDKDWGVHEHLLEEDYRSRRFAITGKGNEIIGVIIAVFFVVTYDWNVSIVSVVVIDIDAIVTFVVVLSVVAVVVFLLLSLSLRSMLTTRLLINAIK